MIAETLTREHRRWEEFVERFEHTMLLGKSWEDYVSQAGARSDEEIGELWLRAYSSACNGRYSGHGHEATLAILADMGMDVASSMKYFRRQGGCCCDCEVMFNVIARDDDE